MKDDGRSGRGGAARRALIAEVERLAGDLRAPLGRLEEAVAALIGGEGLPEDLAPDALFEGGIPRIRPVLVVLASRAAVEAGAGAEGTFEVAAITELLQVSIALHDAALGRRDGRRRRAARRVLRGATAWLGASHVTLRAIELARRVPAPEVMGEALDALRQLAEAHAADESARDRDPTPADALYSHEGHAGVVFAFACRAGGRLAGADRGAVTALGRYGRNVGVAWQLAEELAVFERGGRALADFASSGRPSYVLSWSNANDRTLDVEWQVLARSGDVALADVVAARVRAVGGLQAAREALMVRAWAARGALEPLPASPARDALDRLAAVLARPNHEPSRRGGQPDNP